MPGKCIRSVPLRDGARMLGARCHEARILEARILGYWRLGYWRLGGYKACRPRLGGLALIGVIAGWLVLVLGCVLTRSTLREVGGVPVVGTHEKWVAPARFKTTTNKNPGTV